MRSLAALPALIVSFVAVGLAGVAVSASSVSRDAAATPTPVRLAADTAGPAAMAWRGAWSSTAQYAPGEVVSYQGVSYVATAASTGADPSATPASWDPMSSGFSVSNPVAFGLPALNVNARNKTGKPILVNIDGGVVSDPGENGHLYLEVAAARADGTPYPFQRVAYVACRNTAAATAQIGCGGTLSGIVPVGGFYRLTLVTAANYKTPDYVTDGPTGTFVALG
jgi:hypothetical protein